MIINGKSIRDNEKIRSEINNLTEDEARGLRVFIKGMKFNKESGESPGSDSGKGNREKKETKDEHQTGNNTLGTNETGHLIGREGQDIYTRRLYND